MFFCTAAFLDAIVVVLQIIFCFSFFSYLILNEMMFAVMITMMSTRLGSAEMLMLVAGTNSICHIDDADGIKVDITLGCIFPAISL